MAKLHLAQEILDIIYPVGSIYLSWNSTNPSTYFGGTWVQLKGGFLYGFVESPGTGNGTGTATNGNNGNTGSTTLNIDQIPSHNHLDRIPHTGNATHNTSGDYLPYGGWNPNANSVSYWVETSGTGGGKGHTHTLNNHSHNIPYIAVSVWRRTA